jgi:hypothetical protein
MKCLTALAVVLGLGLCCSHASAQEAVPSHCRDNEFSIVDAWVGELMAKPVNDSYVNKKNRKLLSLCADAEKEPYSIIHYRYGSADKVEMEYKADASNPMNFESTSLGKIGYDIFFFKRGNFTYYVSIQSAMGSGVSLKVYEGNKRIVNRFSGTEEGVDFVWAGESIDTRKKKLRSAALQLAKPMHRVTDD